MYRMVSIADHTPLKVLMRLRNLIPTNAKLMLFKTAILPHLTYCHLVWHFCRASDSRKIERMQERGLRAVFRNNVSYPELLKRAELPSLQNRGLQDICVLMYSQEQSMSPLSVTFLLSIDPSIT